MKANSLMFVKHEIKHNLGWWDVPGVWSVVLALQEHWGGQGCAGAVLERMMDPVAQ